MRVFSFLLSILFSFSLFGSSTITKQSGPHEKLDEMDKRIPVPLLPHMALHQKENMRGHLESVQAIIAGLSNKDFKAIAESASKMGFTPELGQMCQHMGVGAEGFSEMAIHFHKTADTIAQSAKKRDQSGVIKALNETLMQCTSCHSIYRQQIVDEDTMKVYTGKMPIQSP